MVIRDWDEFFMRFAILAALKSKDPSTQVGAVLVKDKRVIATGYNGFCEGVRDPNDWIYGPEAPPDLEKRNVRPEKYWWYEHAERNAIYNAARHGVATAGSIMYTNGTPCANCARGVIQAGVKEVVVLRKLEDNNSEKWAEEAEVSKAMFKEAQVGLRAIDIEIGMKILRGGVLLDI